MGFSEKTSFSAMEVGCGNGYNCIALAEKYPQAVFYGIDFVKEMVDNAKKNMLVENVARNIDFFQGDILKINMYESIPDNLDIIFTDRCLINLRDHTQQCDAISKIYDKLRDGGWLAMIENSQSTYDNQNLCREILGLEKRTPAEFNLFFDEEKIVHFLERIGFSIVGIEDFISVHDLILYVLVPAINGGKVDYEHPLVEAATKLQTGMSAHYESAFGKLGQNRLFLCKKI
jgi:SAM-dependent methyltransferase